MTELMAVTGTAPTVMSAGPQVRVRLPAGGWQVGFRFQLDGRMVVEVTDPGGSLVGLVASTQLPVLSIDGGWIGSAPGLAGVRQWWALAIGHVPAGTGQPAVTFTRRIRRGRIALPPGAVDGLWVAHDGLWIAAAAGHYTHVRLTARSVTQVQALRLVTDPPTAPGPLCTERPTS
jgi:hypothetical protein